MPRPQFSITRKRARSEDRDSLNEIIEPSQKKQKLAHSNESLSLAAFWDNLSKIWLTKSALKELNRRNIPTTKSLSSSHQRIRRPVTRNFQKKRQNSSNATDYLSRCEPRVLGDIKSFARHGGPDLANLRNYPEPTHSSHYKMSSNQSSLRNRKRKSSTSTPNTKPTTTTTKTKSTGPYNRNFAQHLEDCHIFPAMYRFPDGSVPAKPENWEIINQKLAQPRPSLSQSQFSDAEFERFEQADADAAKEMQVRETVIPIIEGTISDGKCRSGSIPFTNLAPITDENLVSGNPDIYYGARPGQLDRQIRTELNDRIIPSTQHDLPIAPNFFVAAKGPDGSLAVANRQACYDGALGARGMHSLQYYGDDEAIYNNTARTITSTYHGGTLKIYTSYLTEPSCPGGPPEYHMTQIKGYSMTGDAETFRRGATAYRNARDWAKEQRDEAIEQANERASARRTRAPATDKTFDIVSSFTTEISANESYTLSQTSQVDDSQTTSDLHASQTSTKGTSSNDKHLRKRRNKQPESSRRKERD